MGRDTIQLDDVVSTISGEYLLVFTSEYGIPEDLHPELPGPEDTILDFSEGKVGAPKDRMPPADSYSALDMDLFNLTNAPNPTKVKTGTRPRAAHEVPLLTSTAKRVIDMEDTIATSESSRTPFVMEKSPLDFVDEDPPQTIIERVRTEGLVQDERSREIPFAEHATTAEVAPEAGLEEEVAVMGSPANKKLKQMRRKRVNEEAEVPKVLRRDHVSSLAHSTYKGKSLAAMVLGAGSISSTPAAQDAPTAVKSVSDSDPLSYAKPQPYPEQDIAQSSKGTATEIPTEDVATTEGVTNDCRLDTPAECQDTMDHIAPPGYFSELRHFPNADFLSQYNMNLTRKVAMGSQLRLRFEQKVRLLKKVRAKIARRDQRIQVRKKDIKKLDQEVKSLRATETKVHGLRNQTKNLDTLLEAEADMKKVAEAKKAELTKELESLRVRFSDLQVNNNQLSQQVSNLQAKITGEEKIKAAFEEFKKYEDTRVEQRSPMGYRARYTPSCREANDKLVKVLQNLKDLKYPMVDQLERLKDAPMELIMASLHLEGDTGEDVPQRIRDLRPSPSQRNIPVYPTVRNPKYPWAVKEEMLSDGIPVSVPTITPQGLAILLKDAATQTEVSEGEASPRLLRSKSLPPMYNLDWP
ncbi:hypothetical protein Tco_0072732 [Tanacetum coccineum]